MKHKTLYPSGRVFFICINATNQKTPKSWAFLRNLIKLYSLLIVFCKKSVQKSYRRHRTAGAKRLDSTHGKFLVDKRNQHPAQMVRKVIIVLPRFKSVHPLDAPIIYTSVHAVVVSDKNTANIALIKKLEKAVRGIRQGKGKAFAKRGDR